MGLEAGGDREVKQEMCRRTWFPSEEEAAPQNCLMGDKGTERGRYGVFSRGPPSTTTPKLLPQRVQRESIFTGWNRRWALPQAGPATLMAAGRVHLALKLMSILSSLGDTFLVRTPGPPV